MTFALPAAFWALSSILVLVLFSLWRLRPVRVTVPSLALWRKLPATVPPVRALRKPRWSAGLLLQALAIGAMVTALASPLLVEKKAGSRRIAVVADLGARARLDRVKTELEAIKAATSHDDVVLYEVPLMKRGPLTSAVDKVDYVGDPGIALNAARSEGRRVIWLGDRGVDADVNVLTGGPSDNIGITDLAVDADGVFVRLYNAGPERNAAVRINGKDEPWRVKAGESTRVFPAPAGPRIEVELPADDFPADNRGVAIRTGEVTVELRGDPHPLLHRVMEVQRAARLVDRGGSFIVALGLRPDGDGVFIDPPGGDPVEPKSFSLADHPLARGMKAADLKMTSVRPLGAGWVPVAFADGAAVIGVKGRTVVVSAALGDWPLTPSFPIFFANVMEWARSGGPLWKVERTGPSRPRVTEDVGLLDPAASTPGTERKPFDPAMLGAAPETEGGRDLTAWAVLASAALALAAWAWERRGD